MGAAERLREIVTSQGMDERKAEGREGNIYRLEQTVKSREEIRLNESTKGRRRVGGSSEKTSKGSEWTEDVGEERKEWRMGKTEAERQM